MRAPALPTLWAAASALVLAAPRPATAGCDPNVTVAIADANPVVEGDSGTVLAAFEVSISPSGFCDTNVFFATDDGTAAAGDGDYAQTDGGFTFLQAGPTVVTVQVPVLGDLDIEADETFFLDISSDPGVIVADPRGEAVIVDDDQPPPPATNEVHLAPAPPVAEDAGSATVVVERTGDASAAAQVTVRFRRGTATPGRDFVAGRQIVVWGVGETGPRPAVVQLLDDSRVEDDETIEVVLESPNGVILGDPSQIDLVLLDDDQPSGLIQLGEPQVVTVVNAVAELAVRVLGDEGEPVAGAAVRWRADEGGELLLDASTLSDAEGVARQRVRLGTQPGIVTVDATLVATGDTVTFRLTAQGDLASLFDSDANPGEASVAGALDGACVAPQGDFAGLCTYVFGLGDDDQRTVVGEMTPREAATQGTLSLDMATSQLRAVGGRLAALRGGATGLAVDQLAFALEGELVPLQELRYGVARFRDEEAWATERVAQAVEGAATPSGTAVATPDEGLDAESRLGVFVSGRVAFGDRPETAREEGFEADIAALTAGLDYRFGERFVLGGALGYVDTNVDLDADGGSLDARGFSLTAYGSYFRTAFYVEGSLGLARNDFDLVRHVDLPLPFQEQSRLVATADPGGDQATASLGLGYDATFAAASLGGFARASWVDATVDGYTETGAGPFDLAIREQGLESLLSELGLGFSYAASFDWGVLLPTVRAAYLHEFEDDSRLVRGRFVDDVEANEFLVPTEDPDRDFFQLSAGLAAMTPGGRSFFLTYDVDLARDDLDLWGLSLGLRLEL